jgi:hypothetical protein
MTDFDRMLAEAAALRRNDQEQRSPGSWMPGGDELDLVESPSSTASARRPWLG